MDLIDRNWHIREYRQGDEHQIIQLRHKVFGDVDPVRLELSTWYWQFRDNPAGQAFCFLADDKGKIVGQYAVIPTRFNVFGEKRILALSCDTMTHPAYRRQGMFVELAKALYHFLESRHAITTIWGFPNEISLSGFTQRLGWNLLAAYPLRILPLRPLEMIRSHVPLICHRLSGRSKFKLKSKIRNNLRRTAIPITRSIPGLTIEPIEKFDESFDELWEIHQNLFPVTQIRDSVYLNWRYLGMPAFDYRPFAVKWKGRVSGYLIIRLTDLIGHFCGILVDLFPFPIVDRTVTQSLLDFARSYCKSQNAEFLTCLLPFADNAFLNKAGFRKIPEWLNPKKWYLGCRYLGKDKKRFAQSDRWYVTYGDTDVV